MIQRFENFFRGSLHYLLCIYIYTYVCIIFIHLSSGHVLHSRRKKGVQMSQHVVCQRMWMTMVVPVCVIEGHGLLRHAQAWRTQSHRS